MNDRGESGAPLARAYPSFVGGWGALALLLVRVVMGTAFIVHGWPKILHPLTWMTAMGPTSIPSLLQALAALAEFGGGVALLIGLLTPFAALGLSFQMLAALFLVHFPRHDPFVGFGRSSFELPLLYLTLAVMFLALGPGKWSLDALLTGDRSALFRAHHP